MATLVDNGYFVKFDTVEVQAQVTEVTPDFSVAAQDTTKGAGTDYNQRAAGLKDVKFSVTLAYDIATLQTYIAKLAPGAVVTFEYGPEGAVSGKPRHVQSMLVVSNSFGQTVQKDPVVFTINLEGADAPSVDMMSNGVYA